MLVAGRDIPGHHALLLVLRQLIVIVGHLEPVARQKQIQVERIAPIRLVVDAIEERLRVTDIVYRQELGRIEKMPRAQSIQRNEIPELGGAVRKRRVLPVGAERAPGRLEAPGRPRSQTALGSRIHHQAGFIAILGVGRTGDQLHALDRIGRKLRRKYFALLVADGLAVDYEADLRVIPQRVKETVGV